jgi:uncharacterized phage protein (TIGR02216 family)
MTAKLDWPGLMRAGLHGLGLKPSEFWALTPVELMVMLGREAPSGGFTRDRLQGLMARYPDRPAARRYDDDPSGRSGGGTGRA